MNTTQLQEQRIATVRRQLTTAEVSGALARGEVKRPTYERLLILSSRYMAHRAAGRVRAAAAVREMAMRIVDSLEG
jgi:hypothetical protein